MSDLDSQELQDLFDQIASTSSAAEPPPAAQPAAAPSSAQQPAGLPSADGVEGIYQGLGHLLRKLHDSLQEIGQDSLLFKADEMLPQSRERLAFIGDLMEKSATQCVQVSEREMPRLETGIASLRQCQTGWQKVVDGQADAGEFKSLALSTPGMLQSAIDDQKSAKDSFMEILMAQGFQDLAGQSLNKVVTQVAGFERELLALLAVAAVDRPEREKLSEFLEGPQFNATAKEAVHNQQEVDDLLKDLGF